MVKPYFLWMRWLQTIPVALLMLAPFHDRELRWGRRRGYLLLTVYLLLGCVGLAALSTASGVNGRRNIAVRDFSLAILLSGYFFAWSYTIKARAARKLLIAGLTLHYAAALNAAANILTELILGERYLAEIGSNDGCLCFDLCLFCVTAVSWPMMRFFFRNTLRKTLDDRDVGRGLGYIYIAFFLFSAATYHPRYSLHPETPVFIFALLLTDAIAYYIFFQELGAVRQLMDFQLQYQQIVSRMDGVWRLRHDVRHHLNALGALNAQGKSEEITAYLKQYCKVYEQLDRLPICGDPAVDSVLGYYLAQAGEEHIPVEHRVELRGGSGLIRMDMTVLLGNCLENAMEALRRVPAEQRRLRVELYTAGDALLLEVVNACEPGADTDGFANWEAFPSRKAWGRTGVGLRSVSEIAKKYGGSAQFRRENGEFTARVELFTYPPGSFSL